MHCIEGNRPSAVQGAESWYGMKRPLHRSGGIKHQVKEGYAMQERLNSGGGTIHGQAWGRLSPNHSGQKEDIK